LFKLKVKYDIHLRYWYLDEKEEEKYKQPKTRLKRGSHQLLLSNVLNTESSWLPAEKDNFNSNYVHYFKERDSFVLPYSLDSGNSISSEEWKGFVRKCKGARVCPSCDEVSSLKLYGKNHTMCKEV
jgi:hypothetical protein